MLKLFFLNNLDRQIAAFFLAGRSYLGIKIFALISFFGNWAFLLPLMFIILYILFIKNKREFITPFFLTVIGAEAVTFFAKLIFRRARPFGAALAETDFSFPSGHATIAAAFYGYLAYILIKLLPAKYKWPVIILTIIIAASIGFSRLYLGVHYLSDVLAGYLIGLTALIAVVNLNFVKKFNVR